MSEAVNIPDIERITFFTGQRLTAADLTELQRANRERRWIHNRALHGWGIAIGFSVRGEIGETKVVINEGFGTDCKGREIILTHSYSVPVPAVAGSPNGGEAAFYLVVAYREDKDQKIAERRPGVCMPEGTVRLSEEPLIAWRPIDKLREGLDIVLAQAWIQNCQLSRPLSLMARRYARPAHQPYIAGGQTPSGETAWVPREVGGQTRELYTTIDTLGARFRTTPKYMAHVVGDRYLAAAPGPLLVVGIPAVVDATPSEFTLKVFLPPIGGDINPGNLSLVEWGDVFNKLQLHVVWLGIEG